MSEINSLEALYAFNLNRVGEFFLMKNNCITNLYIPSFEEYPKGFLMYNALFNVIRFNFSFPYELKVPKKLSKMFFEVYNLLNNLYNRVLILKDSFDEIRNIIPFYINNDDNDKSELENYLNNYLNNTLNFKFSFYKFAVLITKLNIRMLRASKYNNYIRLIVNELKNRLNYINTYNSYMRNFNSLIEDCIFDDKNEANCMPLIECAQQLRHIIDIFLISTKELYFNTIRYINYVFGQMEAQEKFNRSKEDIIKTIYCANDIE